MSNIWSSLNDNDLWNYIIWHYIMDQRQKEVETNPDVFKDILELPFEEYAQKCAAWVMRDPTDEELTSLAKCFNHWKDKNWFERLEEIVEKNA